MIKLNKLFSSVRRSGLLKKKMNMQMAIFLFTMSSCNSGLFINEFLKEDVCRTLSCGDSAVIHFEDKNWDLLNVYSDYPLSIKSYSQDGTLISNGSAEKYPGRVHLYCENNLQTFEVKRSEDRTLIFRPVEMLYDHPTTIHVHVGNEYEEKVLKFTINDGMKYQVDSLVYYWNSFMTYNNSLKEIDHETIHNSTSQPSLLRVKPYQKEANRIFTFFWVSNPEVDHLFAKDTSIQVPDIENGRPVLNYNQIPLADSGIEIKVPEDSLKAETEILVTIAPHETCEVTTYLKMEYFSVDYTLYASHPVSHRQRVFNGRLTSDRPFGNLVLKTKK